MISRSLSPALLATALLIGGMSSAASAATVTYNLFNHPDGNAAEPYYGLRLNELYDVTGGTDHFTFDFERTEITASGGSLMQMTVDDMANTVTLSGRVYGGRITAPGSGMYDADWEGLWDVSMTYSENVTIGTDGDGKMTVMISYDPTHLGTIMSVDVANTTIAAGDSVSFGSAPPVDGKNVFAFAADGHRLGSHPAYAAADPWAGRAWLNTGSYPGDRPQDWLFVANTGPDPFTAVPEPTSMALFAMSAGLIVPLSRRRRKGSAELTE